MADFHTALALTLAHEGGFLHNETTGEVVNRGITLDSLRRLGILKSLGPPTNADIAFVQSLTLEEAADIYRMEFWDKLELDHFNSQEVANKVFDLGVNTGTRQAALFLQRAVRSIPDGIIGMHTVALTNAGDAAQILASIRTQAEAFYRQLAGFYPSLAGNLTGWLQRLAS